MIARAMLILAGMLGATCATATPLYRLAATMALGAPDRWDFLAFDPATARLFVAHGTEMTVVDTTTMRIAGRVPGHAAAHGVVLVPGGHGYAASGKGGAVMVFDPASLASLGAIAAQADADALVYDPASRNLYVMNGDSGSITVIDTRRDRAVATIATGSGLEFAAVDGQGHLFVNQVNTGDMLRIDTATNAVTATWKLPDCAAPHGMAVDAATHHIFTSCENGNITVVDAVTGKVLAQPAIGRGSDAVAFDAARHRVFSSNSDGTLSLVDAVSLRPIGSIATAPGARTMALDPSSGRLFLVTATVASRKTPSQPAVAPRFNFVPGTVKLLVFDPQPGPK
jgi:YVTN family beta-propeller protein